MRRQIGIKFLFGFLLIIAAFGSIKTVCLVPAAIAEQFKTETLSHQSGQNPYSELEGTHFNLATAAHLFVQKNLVHSYLPPVAVLYKLHTSLENSQIRKLSLLIKDYLAFIYPSHNFW